jgi:hypothetical protein
MIGYVGLTGVEVRIGDGIAKIFSLDMFLYTVAEKIFFEINYFTISSG